MSSSQSRHQLEVLKHKQLWFVSLIFLFVIVVTWIGMSLFASQNKLAIPKEMRDLARPLTPTLDDKMLKVLEDKKYYLSSDLAQFPIYRLFTNLETNQSVLMEIGEVVDEKALNKKFVNVNALNKAPGGSSSGVASRSGATQ